MQSVLKFCLSPIGDTTAESISPYPLIGIFVPGINKRIHIHPIKNIIYCLILIAGIHTVRAQDLGFRHYGVDQGLPSSQVHDIIQDQYGNLWFTTDRGLSRFNGYDFRNYTIADGLTDNTIFKFYCQADGKIWCSTFNKSVFCFSGREPVFTPYKFNKILTSLPDVIVPQAIHVTANNELYMGFVNSIGYLHIDADGKILKNQQGHNGLRTNKSVLVHRKKHPDFFYLQPSDQTVKPETYWSGHVSSVPECRGDDLTRACYFQHSASAVFVNPKQITIIRPDHDTLRVTNIHDPISLGQLNDSLFWVGFRYGGVTIYNLDGKVKRRFLMGKSVTRLLVDHEDGFWVSTLNDGVFHARNTFVTTFASVNSEQDWINSITKDKEGRIWLGYYNGNVDVLEQNMLHSIYRPRIKKPAIVATDFPGEKIFYSSDLMLSEGKKTGQLILNFNPTCVYVSPVDSVWIGGYGNAHLAHLQTLTFLKTGFRVNALCHYKGSLYLGSNKGLYVMRNGDVPAYEKVNIVPETWISDLKIFGSVMAIATKGQGVLFYDQKTVSRLDEKAGLANNIINMIYAENQSVLWICTNAGLNRIEKTKSGSFDVKVMSNQQGLISNEVTGITIHHDTAWVGTRQGICFFPAKIMEREPVTRNYYLSIQQVTINDREAGLADGESLSYNQNRVEFSFGAVSFTGSPVVYRYMLEGLQNKWNYTSSREALYSSLPPGTYTFIIQVKGSNQYWDDQEKRIRFTILPPFWKTWWFITGLTVVIVLLIYLFFRYRILSYNRDITRELLRQVLKRFTRKTNYVVFREQGKDIRIPTHTICYVKADGNYIEIHADTQKYLVRFKIGEFLDIVPDPLEYLQISRSYIVRLDKVQAKSKKDVTVNNERLPVGETYLEELKKIRF
ncbi:MAG: signal transduction histidine kinase LytS [Bacteroidetes bacterium]|nr:MAG: signal transduction histidine kinase LytS [Bacteroidota bacterium]